jgi:hypothetical protein
MANPGPASTVSAHPSNVTTNQTLRLLGVLKAVNVNAASGSFFPLPIINSTTYQPTLLIVTNSNNAGAATGTLTSLVLGITTTNSGTPTSLFGAITASQLATVLGVSQVAASAVITSYSQQNLYVNIATTTAVTGTVDVYVYGYDFS